MPQVDRFSVSLDTELLAAFDHHIAQKGYVNRSEAVRDMIRDMILSSRLPEGDDPVLAVLSFLCDQRTGDAAARLREVVIDAGDLVLGSWRTPADTVRAAAWCRKKVERLSGSAWVELALGLALPG